MSLPIVIKIKNKINKRYVGFSFFIFVWIYYGNRYQSQIEKTIRHEKIHFKQQLELLFIFSWIVWAVLRIRSRVLNGKEKAYREHPWEREAYSNQDDLDYLNKRKFLAWTKYI